MKDSSIQSIAFVSLGCPKNLVDSERMLGLLTSDGLIVTPLVQDADAIVINTCGFLEASKVESMEEIRKAVQLKTTGRCKRVIVAGCLAQRYKTALLTEEPGIDRLVGVFDREHIVRAVRGKDAGRTGKDHWLGKYHELGSRYATLQNDVGRLRLTPRHYAYLRVSEGCSRGCSFCTIPAIRGPMRSKPIDRIMAEARELADDGAVEINLIGQDTTSYGVDIGYKEGLAGLLRTLDRRLGEVAWLRLMYAYPSCFSDEMIQALAGCERVVKYLDIPLQHINDEVLRKMRRRVTRRQIETLLEKLRRCVPGIAIRTTFIAGTPGETKAQHRELARFVRDFGFDNLGVFAYSAEPGTAMARMKGQVSAAVKKERVEELMLAQQAVAFARGREMVGKAIEVLVERPGQVEQVGHWIARSRGQAPEIDGLVILQDGAWHAGQLAAVEVTDAREYDLVARALISNKRSLRVVHG